MNNNSNNSFNPSQENTAVLTHSGPETSQAHLLFQPLSGKHGRSDNYLC